MIQERINWLMGVKFEDESLPMINDEVSCPYDTCDNRGNFANCYSELKDECHQHNMWMRCYNRE